MRPKRIASIAAVCAVAIGLGPFDARGTEVQAHQGRLHAKASRAATLQRHHEIVALKQKINYLVRATAYWRGQALLPPPGSRHVRQLAGLAPLKQQLRRWQGREKAARIHAQNPPHKAQLLCIHGYEGSWQDAGEPYWGGLQMNDYFEAAYGAPLVYRYGGHIALDSGGHKYAVGGHANLWTPLQQMWAAERAVASRGFWPWPNTARDCGLIP